MAGDNQLCYSVAIVDCEWFVAVVNKNHSYFSSIIRISICVIPSALYLMALCFYVYTQVRPYLHRKAGQGTRVGIIACTAQPLVVEPSNYIMCFIGLAADYPIKLGFPAIHPVLERQIVVCNQCSACIPFAFYIDQGSYSIYLEL